MEIYIQARSKVFNSQYIKSVQRGARLFPFNLQRVLYTIVQGTPLEVERPKTPT